MDFIVRAERKVFAAFALLNTIGYNAENGWHFSNVRKGVRMKLARRASYWRSTLDNAGLLEPLLRAGGAMLMDVIPFISLDDDDTIEGGTTECLVSWQREARGELDGIEDWLRRFYTEESVEGLWSEQGKNYREAERLWGEVIPSLQSLAARFSQRAGGVTTTLLPNLLDTRARGYSLSTVASTWLYLGPVGDRPDAEPLAAHELLHRWVDSIAEKAVGPVETSDTMTRARALFRVVADSYPDMAIWVGETVVRAATTLFAPRPASSTLEDEEDVIGFHEQVGFIGFKDAYRCLATKPERPLEEALGEAVYLVLERIKNW